MFQPYDNDFFDGSFDKFFQDNHDGRFSLMTDPRSSMFTPSPFDFGRGFAPMNDALHVTELPDRYVVLMQDLGGLEGKEFKVDYSKENNLLTVTMEKTEITSGGTSSSTSQNSVSFDKLIDYNNISSSIEGDSLVITVLKAVGNRLENDKRNFIEGIDTSNHPEPALVGAGPVAELTDDQPLVEELSDDEPIEVLSGDSYVEEISD